VLATLRLFVLLVPLTEEDTDKRLSVRGAVGCCWVFVFDVAGEASYQ
jgi:hypothetical protein